MSNAHLGVAPPPSQLQSHAVDLNHSDDEVPPPHVATNILSSFIAPSPVSPIVAFDSKIADAITALFVHVHVIHLDFVEHIGQVHEHVDLIVER
ncbi:hypothetical protein Acr_25g0001370 [Actinidia rufa]|uniref:Uncharacterized protein n=1 Tax=Actinidia rufa TaxID=165716 RepID=A0A7J0GYC2_9ERIC|nr:hypothetical protein Acr_25g0001370 [Actinidia rufa]